MPAQNALPRDASSTAQTASSSLAVSSAAMISAYIWLFAGVQLLGAVLRDDAQAVPDRHVYGPVRRHVATGPASSPLCQQT